MDHLQATQSMAVEKYLLDELTPAVRDEFEEHYFDCQECAIDLRVTDQFMDWAKKEFQENPVAKPAQAVARKTRMAILRPVLAWSALAASLLVIAYQNVAVFPHLQSEVAELRAPEVLPSLSLAAGNSRGGTIPSVTLGPAQAFLLLVDIPAQDRFSSYTCLLYSPSGSLVWRVEVSEQSAKDTISIRVPAVNRPTGDYTLTVQGNDRNAGVPAVDLAHDHFTLSSRN